MDFSPFLNDYPQKEKSIRDCMCYKVYPNALGYANSFNKKRNEKRHESNRFLAKSHEFFAHKPMINLIHGRCVRVKSFGLKGYKEEYLFATGNLVLHSKVKVFSNPESIGLKIGSTSHISVKDYDATLLTANNFCDFSLREGSSFGNEKLSIQIRPISENQPRKIKLYFFQNNMIPFDMLESVDPILDDEGGWIIDLNTDNAISSIKNSRFEDSDHNPVIIIRKVEESELEIEYADFFNEFIAFSLCMASFLCKK